METHSLSFCMVFNHGNGIIEALADEGIEVSVDNMLELRNLMDDIQPVPRCLLANRLNPYAFSFEAMQMIRQMQGINAVAILVYSDIGAQAAEQNTSEIFETAVFHNRDDALGWLEQKL